MSRDGRRDGEEVSLVTVKMEAGGGREGGREGWIGQRGRWGERNNTGLD